MLAIITATVTSVQGIDVKVAGVRVSAVTFNAVIV
jgi:hypothetical protein